MRKIINTLIMVLRYTIPIFLVSAYIDFLIYLNGGSTIFLHMSHKISGMLNFFLIWTIIYLVALYLDIIYRKSWKKLAVLSFFFIVVLSVLFATIKTYADIANSNSFEFIENLAKMKTDNFKIDCEAGIKKSYDCFLKNYKISKISAIKHYPLLGRHIFLVQPSEGFEPFVIDLNRSFDGKVFLWIHSEKSTLKTRRQNTVTTSPIARRRQETTNPATGILRSKRWYSTRSSSFCTQ